jgi:hypothetical protein
MLFIRGLNYALICICTKDKKVSIKKYCILRISFYLFLSMMIIKVLPNYTFCVGDQHKNPWFFFQLRLPLHCFSDQEVHYYSN